MFTASATRNRQGAAVGGVGVVVKCALLQNLVSVTKITDRIIHALFKGNPKAHVISCYSPTNVVMKKTLQSSTKALTRQYYTSLHMPVL